MCRKARSRISLCFAGLQLASRGEFLTPPAKFSIFSRTFELSLRELSTGTRAVCTTIFRHFLLCLFLCILSIYFVYLILFIFFLYFISFVYIFHLCNGTLIAFPGLFHEYFLIYLVYIFYVSDLCIYFSV
jgi:hypothetical protein